MLPTTTTPIDVKAGIGGGQGFVAHFLPLLSHGCHCHPPVPRYVSTAAFPNSTSFHFPGEFVATSFQMSLLGDVLQELISLDLPQPHPHYRQISLV
uniref:Uncharacterized protein n=1 Tax=Oryza brachyantha TaxID=4533 RepID=J3M540_ORYBR